MAVTLEDIIALESLETKLRAILPEQYQDTYESVVPVSMGSAGLKYSVDGRVAWNEMWATFCDLSMAGGPPHRGTLLEPASSFDIAENRAAYDRVVEEIGRGITLVTALPVQPSQDRRPGWISVACHSIGMAGWLVRAIVMENVMARHQQATLYLPASPDFRIGKEIKNVITATAKTCHYWSDHMSAEQQQSIDRVFANAAPGFELLEPALRDAVEDAPERYREFLTEMAQQISQRLGKTCFANRYIGWIGVEFPNEHTAIWLMRALVVENILSRREESILFLPVQSRFAEHGRLSRLLDTLERGIRLYALKKF